MGATKMSGPREAATAVRHAHDNVRSSAPALPHTPLRGCFVAAPHPLARPSLCP